MGLFGSDTHKKTVTYGQQETDALQPGLFDLWRRIYGGYGNPYMQNINADIQGAYQRAAQEAGVGVNPAAQRAIQADVGRRGGIAGDQMSGAVGMAGQQNLLNTAGQQAGYLGALTAARPQFAFESATPWDQFFGGLSTLYKPVEPLMRVAGAWPQSWEQQQPPLQPMPASPFTLRF